MDIYRGYERVLLLVTEYRNLFPAWLPSLRPVTAFAEAITAGILDSMKRKITQLGCCLTAWMIVSPTSRAAAIDFFDTYKGEPYHDSRYHSGPQPIPGEVQCAFYDLGGEGIAYHDTDAKNDGSGALNPADGTYLNEFRMHEGVDISYTKFHHQIDNTQYNLVQPPENQLYVGWTQPGEWFNVTVQVDQAGVYTADLLYTANRGGSISLDVNGNPAGAPLLISATFNAADPIAWRQWHHWNLAPSLLKVELPKGKSVLTVHIVTEGQMNLAYFDFRQAR